MPRDATYAKYEPKSEDERNLHDAWVEYYNLLEEKKKFNIEKDRALNIALYTPLIIASKIFKMTFSNILGFKWLIRRISPNVSNFYNRDYKITLPNIGISEHRGGIYLSKKSYCVKPWAWPLVGLNYIARTIGQLLGLTIGLIFAVPAYVFTKIFYLPKEIIFNIKLNSSLANTYKPASKFFKVEINSKNDLASRINRHSETRLLNDMISAFKSAVDDYLTLPKPTEDRTDDCNFSYSWINVDDINNQRIIRYCSAIYAFLQSQARFPADTDDLTKYLSELRFEIIKEIRSGNNVETILNSMFEKLDNYCTKTKYEAEAVEFAILNNANPYRKAECLLKRGDKEEAFDLFSSISIDSPHYFDAMMACGTLLKVEKRYSEALEYFYRARQSEERTMAGIDRMRQRDSEALFEIAFTEWVLEEESMQHDEDIPSYLSESKRNPTKMEIANQPKFVASKIKFTDCKATFLASNPYGWRHPSQMNFRNKNSINKSNLPYFLQPNLHRKK